ncbi:MAG: FAD-dependent oxidoreductase, partial [Clostridia bacterium]|nr:FAD-dependent oxidoreductase [Clostridia bacterium]
MPNMQQNKTKVQELEAAIRRRTFDEVCLGYTANEAHNEALRCLNCKDPRCVAACPVNVQIPTFISLIAQGRAEEAYQTIKSTNALPAICGRVCPQENQCEGACVRGIKGEPVAIGRLERFAADSHVRNAPSQSANSSQKLNKRVAVIGSGPSGLACAGDLAKAGVDVTVFEAFH